MDIYFGPYFAKVHGIGETEITRMSIPYDDEVDDSTKLETCESCNGTGEYDISDDDLPLMHDCEDCGGVGYYEGC